MPPALPESPHLYPVRYYRPQAAAYFLRGFSFGDFKTKGDLQKYFSDLVTQEGDTEQIHYVSNPDVQSMSLNLTIKNAPSRFTLRVSNRGDKWFVKDNPQEEIPKLRSLSEGESADDRLKKLAPEGATFDLSKGNKYPHSTLKDWWEYSHFVYVEQSVSSLGTESFRAMVYREVDSTENTTQYYYFDSDGRRVNLTKDLEDNEGFTHYIIQATDTLSSIAAVQLQDPGLWPLVKTFKNNSEVFIVEKEPTLGDSLLGAYAGEEIAIPTITQGLPNNARIVAIPNSTLYWRLGGSLDSRGRCVFSPMDRVVLFLSGRFAPKDRPLLRSFTGLVDSVSEVTNASGSTITIQGSDVTKWLLLTQYNINPALFPVADVLQAQNNHSLEIFTNVFAGKTGAEIIRDVILGGTWNLWSESTPGSGLELPLGAAASLTGSGPFIRESKRVQGRSYFIETPESGYDFRYVASGPLAIASKSVKDELRRPYRLWIQNPFSEQYRDSTGVLTGLVPYRKYWRNSFELWQSEYTNRRDICYQAAQKTNFFFYADGNGDIHYRQPRYDLGHILGAETPEIYILDDESLLEFQSSESDEDLVTRMYVMGEVDYLQLSDADKFLIGAYGVYEDANLANTFGQRIQVISEPMISSTPGSTDTTDYTYFAKSLVHRKAYERFKASAQLTARAELTPGFPVFVPRRNRVYLMESVSHDYIQGKQFTTSCELALGRAPWQILEELLTYKATGILGQDEAMKYFSRLGLAEILFNEEIPVNQMRELTLTEFIIDLRRSSGTSRDSDWWDTDVESSDGGVVLSWQQGGRLISVKPLSQGTLWQVVRSGESYSYKVSVGKLKQDNIASQGGSGATTFARGSVIEMTYVIPSGDRATAEALAQNASQRKLIDNSNVRLRPFLLAQANPISWPKYYITINGELYSPSQLASFTTILETETGSGPLTVTPDPNIITLP